MQRTAVSAGQTRVAACDTHATPRPLLSRVGASRKAGTVHENVSYVAASAGDGDLSIQVYARDNQELSRFVDEVVGRINGVLRTRTALVPWKLKDVHEWQITKPVE